MMERIVAHSTRHLCRFLLVLLICSVHKCFSLQGSSSSSKSRSRQRSCNSIHKSSSSVACRISNDDNYYDIILAPSTNTRLDKSVLPTVRKRILQEGIGDPPLPQSTNCQVSIDYSGRLASLHDGTEYWTPQDVIECWLSEQQGLLPFVDTLKDAFLEHDIDSTKLMDTEHVFTEDFVTNTLGISNNKIACKKLVMAAKRLSQERQEHQSSTVGRVFDSSQQRGGRPYSFSLDPKQKHNKAIPAVALAVQSMKVGERCQILTRCDYAYGKEGLRTSKGDVLIPPFATLIFDLTLLEIQTKNDA